MLGEFLTRCLLMFFGYAYPAFECYKSVVKNAVYVEELRFWCQYWIIVAILTVLERIGDAFISWVPMYGEMKLALFIYLWYPKTKGTGYVFDMLLKPYVANHETDIERKMQEWRVRAWDLALFYWKNCTELGQSGFFQVVQYLTSQSPATKKSKKQGFERNELESSSVPPPPPNRWPSFSRRPTAEETNRSSWWAPPPPSAPPHQAQSEYLDAEEEFASLRNHSNQSHRQARHRR